MRPCCVHKSTPGNMNDCFEWKLLNIEYFQVLMLTKNCFWINNVLNRNRYFLQLPLHLKLITAIINLYKMHIVTIICWERKYFMEPQLEGHSFFDRNFRVSSRRTATTVWQIPRVGIFIFLQVQSRRLFSIYGI